MTRDDIFVLCKKIAPKYGYDPIMVLAQIEQESSYDPMIPRVEEGYLMKYVRTDPALRDITPVVQVMLASSYGYGQLMGHSLFKLGYFINTDSVTVATYIDHYVVAPEEQIDTMCKWLKVKQNLGDSHTLDDALRRYNGSSDYPPLVYARAEKLKPIYTQLAGGN